MNLTDRVVLFTGARRVGAAIAEAVARAGAHVALTYNRSRDEAEATAASVRKIGRRTLVLQANVLDADAFTAVVREIDREFGRLDVLVSMASLYESLTFDKMEAADWDKQVGVDLRGSFLAAKAAVPLMRRTGGGRIINFSDWLAV